MSFWETLKSSTPPPSQYFQIDFVFTFQHVLIFFDEFCFL